jgi:hypothetical protein
VNPRQDGGALFAQATKTGFRVSHHLVNTDLQHGLRFRERTQARLPAGDARLKPFLVEKLPAFADPGRDRRPRFLGLALFVVVSGRRGLGCFRRGGGWRRTGGAAFGPGACGGDPAPLAGPAAFAGAAPAGPALPPASPAASFSVVLAGPALD